MPALLDVLNLMQANEEDEEHYLVDHSIVLYLVRTSGSHACHVYGAVHEGS